MRLTLVRCSDEDEGERARRAEESAALSKRARIQAQREALPSYAYRNEFIKAVLKHQVRAWNNLVVPVQMEKL